MPLSMTKIAYRSGSLDNLRPWVEAQMRARTQALYGWGSGVLESVEGDPTHLDRLPMMQVPGQRVLVVLGAHASLGIDISEHVPEALARWYARTR